MRATTLPIGADPPSRITMSRIVPAAGDSTSTAAFSDSISKSGSPLATAAPFLASQRAILPVVESTSMRGKVTSIGIALPVFDEGGRRVAVTAGRQPCFASICRRFHLVAKQLPDPGAQMNKGFEVHDLVYRQLCPAFRQPG